MLKSKPGFKVEYRTPLGQFDTWEEAADQCERSDFDPCLCIEILINGEACHRVTANDRLI